MIKILLSKKFGELRWTQADLARKTGRKLHYGTVYGRLRALKCSPERFHSLLEEIGTYPASLARWSWDSSACEPPGAIISGGFQVQEGSYIKKDMLKKPESCGFFLASLHGKWYNPPVAIQNPKEKRI